MVPAVSDANRYAIDGAMCVCRTDDGGQTWQQFRSGLPQHHAYHLVYRHGLALAPATGGERTLAMASTTGGVWISDDAGEAWSTLDASLPPVAAVTWACSRGRVARAGAHATGRLTTLIREPPSDCGTQHRWQLRLIGGLRQR